MPRPPVITEQPQGTNVAAGTAVTLSVDIGPSILATRYQWEYSPTGTGTWTPLNAATNRTLPLPDVQLNQAGFYRANVLNAVGQRQSDPAKLGVLELQAVGLAQPSVSRGANVTLTPTPRLIDSPQFAWFWNGLPLAMPGRSLSLTNVSRGSHAGTYRVTATPLSGNPVSADLTLEVDETFAKITTGDVVTDATLTWGCAWGDFNHDQYLDLVVSGSPNVVGNNTQLYRNNADGTFSRITEGPIPRSTAQRGGCVWGDFDNDGDLDLATGPDVVFVNQGDGTFQEQRFATLVTGGPVPVGSNLAWGDYNRDGWLDLIVGLWDPTPTTERDTLLHNNGDGTFSPVSNSAVAIPGTANENMYWIDCDNDGDLDLFSTTGVRDELRPNLLFQNLGGGTFERVLTGPLVEDQAEFSGAAWADYDSDGDLDVYVTARRSTGGGLYQNQGDGTFVRLIQGTLPTLPGNSETVAWGDFDNDGHLDLYLARSGEPILAGTLRFSGERNRLFRNLGDGTFTEITAGSPANDADASYVCAWADYDNDGSLDLFVGNGRYEGEKTANALYRNQGNANHWLKVRPVGSVSNRAAIGARVVVEASIAGTPRRQLRQITAQSSQQELVAHFGLGDAPVVDTLRIEWPSGIVQELRDITPDQHLTVHEPALRVPPLPARPNVGDPVELTSTLAWPTNATRVEYQWRINDQDIPGATDPTYTIASFQESDVGTYQLTATLTDPVLGQYRAWAVPIVAELDKPVPGVPVIMPAYVPSLGASMTIKCTIAGPQPIYWQWQHEGTNVSTVNTGGRIQFPLINLDRSHAGEYRLIAWNANGTNRSAPLDLIIDTTFRQITTDPIVARDGNSRGGAWGDIDDDGDLDLVVPPYAATVGLFLNQGQGDFVEASPTKTQLPDYSDGNGAVWFDYDNTNGLDLHLATHVYNLNDDFYANNGRGVFLRLTGREFGVLATSMKFGGTRAWADFNNDGWVDLLESAYATDQRSSLWLNLEGRGFVRATNPALPDGMFGLSCADYDDDGWMDVLFSEASAPQVSGAFLFRNEGSGRLSQVLELPNARAHAAAWGDYDNDGDLDLFVPVWMERAPNLLYRNDHGVLSPVEGSLLQPEPNWSVAASWVDFDNDGFLDLHVARAGGPNIGANWGTMLPSLLYKNEGATNFTLITTGTLVNDPQLGVSSSWADCNGDGFMDVFIATAANLASPQGYPDLLYLTTPNKNNWVIVRLKGRVSNAQGVGAKVRTEAIYAGRRRSQMRQIIGGDGWGNTSPLYAHFGLGDATQIDVLRIEWPSRIVQEFQSVAPSQYLTIHEPAVQFTIDATAPEPGQPVTLQAPTDWANATYQWLRNGEEIAGQTSATLVITSFQVADEGAYAVRITADADPTYGSFTGTSRPVTVELAGKPVITSVNLAPASVSIGASITAQVRVSANTAQPLTYQWQHNGISIRTDLHPSAATATLTLANVTLASAGDYRVIVYNDRAPGGVTSTSVMLHVDPTFTKITTGPVVEGIGITRPGCWFDYDNDGDLDILVGTDPSIRFYRNDGQDRFTRLSAGDLGVLPQGNRCLPGDYNNDGWLDLFSSDNMIYRNDQGRFSVASPEESGDLGNISGPGHAFADYDNDGHLDFFGATYPIPPNRLCRNRGGGHYVSITNALTTYVHSPWSAGPSWGDFDNDGDSDIFVGSLGNAPRMFFRNDGAGVFTRMTNSGVDLSVNPTLCGVWGDYDNDGFLDLFVPSASGMKDQLYRNQGDGTFVLFTAGAVGASPTAVQARGAGWADYDNDGYLDLFVANWTGDTNRLYRNLGDGTLAAVTTGSLVSDPGEWHGVAWGDYNRDGAMDLWVGCLNEARCLLYRNNGNGNTWLGVQLRGRLSNSYGIGAHVRAKATIRGAEMWQLREITAGDGFSTTLPPEANFGLGDATQVDVLRIEWPSGIVQELQAVPPNTYYTIQEPAIRLESDPPYSSHPSPLPVLAVPTNSPVTFNTTFTPPGAQYRWFKNGALIEGAEGPALVLSALVAADAGTYHVEIDYPETLQVHGADPVTVSAHVTQPGIRLEIEGAPVFLGQLKGQSVSLGADVTFGAPRHSGTRPLAYQWQKDGTDLAGATNAILVLTAVTEADAGLYQLRLSNPLGEARQSARLEVDPTFRKITANPIVQNPAINSAGSWGDYDGDGNLDLYLPALSWGYPDSHDVLYRNLGGGTFESLNSLPSSPPMIRESAAAVWGDYDNDGHLDLFLSSATLPRRLFHNLGDGTFTNPPPEEIGDLARLMDDAGGAAWADYDRDGYLDLAVTPWASTDGTRLWRNSAGQRFDLAPNSLQPPITAQSMSLVWGDYDGDGYPDLFVGGDYALANDSARLYRNRGDGTFTPLTRLFGQDREALLSGAWADYDNDGDLDLFVVSSLANPNGRNRLYRNRGDGTFERLTDGHPVLEGGYSWGAVWGDYNNDGFLDLYVANWEFSTPGTWGHPYPNYLYQGQPDGSFIKITTGSPVTDLARSSGASWADYNHDGFLDLLVANNDPDADSCLYEGIPNGNAWVKVQLDGTVSNRKGVGARVLVKARYAGSDRWQLREIQGGDGFTHSAPLEAHFGLGDAIQVDVLRIEWPSGVVQEFYDQAVNTAQIAAEPPKRPLPRPQSVSLGGTANLSSLNGNSYQWFFAGHALEGETNRTLRIPNATLTHAGLYSVEVILSDGSLLILPVPLDVDPTFTRMTSGSIANDQASSKGAVWVDFNQDGYLDLSVGNRESNFLYLNNGDESFTRITEDNPIVAASAPTYPMAWGDYDNDGLLDLLVGNVRQRDEFYHNLGDGRFAVIEGSALTVDFLFTVPIVWADFNGDGYLDLFAGKWDGNRDHLYLNNRDGTFTKVTDSNNQIIVNSRNTESAGAGDFDDDGDLDLAVAASRETGALEIYHNDGQGVFTALLQSGVLPALDDCIGIAWGDYDNDGDLDLVATRAGRVVLYRNDGDSGFSPVIPNTLHSHYSINAIWADYDNDAYLDLFITTQGGPNQLYRNNGDATFALVERGSLSQDLDGGDWSVGCSWGDYNNDGFLDLYVANGNTDTVNYFYRNNGNANHWLQVQLRGLAPAIVPGFDAGPSRFSNRFGVGAKIRAQATINGTPTCQLRHICPGDGQTGSGLRAHFGLGDAQIIDTLRIEWPSGIVQELTNVPVDQILTVTEPRPEPSLIQPRLQSDGTFQFTVLSEAGKTNVLEQSFDLTDWTVLGTSMVGATNLIEIQPDAQSPGRFYRVREEGGP